MLVLLQEPVIPCAFYRVESKCLWNGLGWGGGEAAIWVCWFLKKSLNFVFAFNLCHPSN